MDTPRTNLGDATYLSRAPPDFDMTQESSFHSPDKDNFLQQMRNGRGANLRTPRGNSRAPLGDKRNLPAGLGGAEFTPLLKSATRRSARRFGKENTNGSTATPAGNLGRIDEDLDMTNVESSIFRRSRNDSYTEPTPLPQVESSSPVSTPTAILPRRRGDNGPLQDGNQLSLREQENVIEKIQNENFNLKLTIHFLEDALRKAGPELNEVALKENTELKVNKLTIERELKKYKKTLASAEQDLETYQQQILEIQEKAKKKYADASQKAENEALRRALEDKDAEIDDLRQRLQRESKDKGRIDQLQDEIGDLETDIRRKDEEINEREEEVDELKTKLEEAEDKWKSAQDQIAKLEEQAQPPEDIGKLDELRDKIGELEADLREKNLEINDRDEELNDLDEKLAQAEEKWNSAQQKITELEQNAQSSEELDEAKGTIEDLEANVRRLEQRLDEMNEQLQTAISDKDRAEEDLEELQEEMSNKSMVTKGLSRQVEEKVIRLQTEVNHWQEKYDLLKQDANDKDVFTTEVKSRAEQLLQQRETWDRERKQLTSKLEDIQKDLNTRTDEKNLLQLRHDALGDESASLQRDVARLQKQIDQLELGLDQEKSHSLQNERDLKRKHQLEVDRLNDDIADLQDEIGRVRQEASGGQSASASLEREVSRLQKRIEELEKSLQQEKARSLQNLYEANANHKSEVDRLNDNIADLKDEMDRVRKEASGGQSASASLEREVERSQKRIKELEKSLDQERANARVRHSASGDESASLQREVTHLRKQVNDLELSLDQEKSHGRQIERDVRNQLKTEIDRLKDGIATLRAEISEKENLYSNDSERWEAERRDLEAQRDRLEERASGLEETISRLRDAEGTLSSKEMKLQDALNNETQRHKKEEAALSRQIDDLRHDLETRQSSLTTLRNDIAVLREDLRQSQLGYRAQSEKVQALEDEVEVLQATLDEEAEDAAQKLDEADQMCEDLRRQVEQAQRNQSQKAGDLGAQLNEANRVSEDLRKQLAEANRKLRDVERQCERLKQESERVSRHESKEAGRQLEQANRVAEGLRRDLKRATRESEKANRTCEELREQLEAAKQDLDYASPLCKELRQKLDRARSERAAYKASAEKLQADCERLQEGAREALAWIEAKNAADNENGGAPGTQYTPHIFKRGTKASFRYGDIVMDVVDQRDHEAVIRAADSAERRHVKELRGMALQMQWMQARWEREAKLRNDAAFAKKFLSLQLEIAEACNKADLRILRSIHKQLGIKSPDALLSSRKREQAAKKSGLPSSSSKTPNKLRVFANVLRAVARMRISAREWGEHERTRKRLVDALEENKRREVAELN